ncbi:MAG TPA: hypothetical protein VM619_14875 [Luteimonas sp.]|nr:hypothetical protein [Luteimonas sp.]
MTLRFAAADRDQVVGGYTYKSAQIERDAIKQTVERAKDKLKIRMAYLLTPNEPAEGWPVTQQIGDWWRPYIPSDAIQVECLSWDPDSVDAPRSEWLGWAVQPVYDDAQLELTCDPNPSAGSMGNQGFKCQKACTKVVYSTGIRGCNLDPEDFKIEATIASKDALKLQAADFIGTPFTLAHGWLSWTRLDGIVEERPIMAHNNTTGEVTVLWEGVELEVGAEVVALPNCPGTWAACEARRPDPQNHYGGAIYKPVKDPIAQGVSMSWG